MLIKTERSLLDRLTKTLLGLLLSLTNPVASSAAPEHRAALTQAILSQDGKEQAELIKKLIDANDPLVEQALAAWRLGNLYINEGANGVRTPFLLDAQLDSEGKAKGIQIADGEFIKDATGKPLLFLNSELTAAENDSKLRKAIKTALDLFALANPNPLMRRDAVIKLGQDQNPDYIPHFAARLTKESDSRVPGELGRADT